MIPEHSGVTTLGFHARGDPRITRLKTLTQHIDHIQKKGNRQGAAQQAGDRRLVEYQQSYVCNGSGRGRAVTGSKRSHFTEGLKGTALRDAFVPAINGYTALKDDIEVAPCVPLPEDDVASLQRFRTPERSNQIDGLRIKAFENSRSLETCVIFHGRIQAAVAVVGADLRARICPSAMGSGPVPIQIRRRSQWGLRRRGCYGEFKDSFH